MIGKINFTKKKLLNTEFFIIYPKNNNNNHLVRIINPIELGVRAKIWKKLKFLARARAPKRKQKNGKKKYNIKINTKPFWDATKELCCYCTPQNSSEKILKNEMFVIDLLLLLHIVLSKRKKKKEFFFWLIKKNWEEKNNRIKKMLEKITLTFKTNEYIK